MAFDEMLADRIRQSLGKRKGLTEKKMFGGIGFMLNGNMCCGILKNDMLIRLAADSAEKALQEPNTRPFEMGGRTMAGWIMIGASGLKDEQALSKWIQRAAKFATSLPAK